MPKTLNLDTLKGFKPKGVNVDKTIINGALKEYNIVEAKELTDRQAKNPPPEQPVRKTQASPLPRPSSKSGQPPSPGLDSSIISIQQKYEKEIKKLKLENEQLKGLSINTHESFELMPRKLRNNFNKFINAIKAEANAQGTDWPILSTNKLRRTYKVTADSFKDCLDYGLSENLIERREKSYSGKVTTWCYRLIVNSKT